MSTGKTPARVMFVSPIVVGRVVVGRVGALAVALGVGGVLAAIPWTASADDSSTAAARSAERAPGSRDVRPAAAARVLSGAAVLSGAPVSSPAPAAAPRAAHVAGPRGGSPLGPPPQSAPFPLPRPLIPPAPPSPPSPPSPAPSPSPPQPVTPQITYRSFDGSGNSLSVPGLNAVGADFSRIGSAHFSDGISALRTDLPNARTVSNIVVDGNGDTPNAEGLSGMMYAWGQFIDHDINLTLSDGTTHIDVAVPSGDATLSGSISMTRAVIDPATGVAGKPAVTTNNVTGWLDGSMVYGSNATTAASLRGSDGHLLSSAGNNLPIVDGAFVAGDSRVQENPDLTALQTVFMREHNRQVDLLKAAHPDWTGDQLYNQARAIVTAEIEHITYSEFLPHLVGANAIAPYQGYKPTADARLTEEFAGAAFRLGHSIVSANLQKTDEFGNPAGPAVTLKDAFFQDTASFEANGGADGLVRHLTNDPSNALDVHIVDDLRNFLFGPAAGLDLAAINLQRGRDLGLGTLNETRASLGLAPYTSFSQITSDATTAAALQSAYGDVNKVELWVGGLAEDHLSGAMVGQTFDVIISKQFTNLRDGDRLWYQNQGFDAATLRSIDSTTLSSVILNNTDIANMQSDAFVFYERRTGSSAAEDPTAPQLVVGANGGDTLTGGTKADLLVAGTGRQTLTGAAGADTFIVGTTGVRAVITDFKVGQDRLQFKNLGQPGKSGVKVTIEDGHVVITFAGNTVSLLGVSAKQFKLSDVSFT